MIMNILIIIFCFEIKESKITRGHNYTLVENQQSRLDVIYTYIIHIRPRGSHGTTVQSL